MRPIAMPRVFLLILTILCLTACQGAVRPHDSDHVTGIYYLLKVDGNPVPGTVSHDGAALELHSGTFIISEDGTCFSRTRFISPAGEEVIREVRAHYVVEGSRLIMKWEGAGTTEGTVENDIFIMDNHGMIFEYTRNPSQTMPGIAKQY